MLLLEVDKTDPVRVVLFERHPSHPNGEAFVKSDGRTYRVGDTPAVRTLTRVPGARLREDAPRRRTPELTDVDGLGAVTAAKLKDAGIADVRALAEHTGGAVGGEGWHVSDSKMARLVASAQELIDQT